MRAAIITGAAGGIGQALVRAFHEAGYRTVATDLHDAGIGADAFVQIDLDRYCQDEELRRQATADLMGAAGQADIGVLVNNAAVQVLGDSSTLTAEQWQRTLNVNLLAPFLLAQALLDRLAAGRGSVVNIASIHATLTKPRFVCYATSKAALVGLTRSMAVDIGRLVRVNAICPAAVNTEMLQEGFAGRPEPLAALAAMHPVGRIGVPAEVAGAAVYLASEQAMFINGAVIEVHGGIGARLHDPV